MKKGMKMTLALAVQAAMVTAFFFGSIYLNTKYPMLFPWIFFASIFVQAVVMGVAQYQAKQFTRPTDIKDVLVIYIIDNLATGLVVAFVLAVMFLL